MTKNFDEIEDSLGIAKSEEKVEIMKPEVVPERNKDDVTKDYEYTRGNLYSIIEKGQEDYQRYS